MERLERLHQRFLHEILGLCAIAVEPHRVAKQPVDVRHGFGFEREPAAIGVGVSVHRVSRLTCGPQRLRLHGADDGSSPGRPSATPVSRPDVIDRARG